MQKVGVLTFHNTSNYGAALQAYATLEALADIGVDAEIIDYSNKARERKYKACYRVLDSILAGHFKVAIKYLLLWPGILARNYSFYMFYKKYIKTSQVVYRTTSALKSGASHYDAIIAGSDQIWSYKNNNKDFNYLLQFVPDDVRKLSYGSSFGLSEIPKSLIENYKKNLSRINYISVREKKGLEIVKSITGREAFLALDPVLLHGKKFWDGMAERVEFESGTFHLYYINDNCYRSLPIFNKKNLSLSKKVSVGSFKINDILDKNFFIRNAKGPRSFIGYIKNARSVYTTSFHAVVFCLIFNVTFYVFLSGDIGRDSRIIQVLNDFKLFDRAIHKDQISGFPDDETNFDEFNNQWADGCLKCRFYLQNALILSK